MRMRTNRIVEAFYVFEKAQIQFAYGGIGTTFNFFFFQILKKAFHNSIIIRMTFCGKRLRVSRFSEIMRSKLRTSIRMENNAGRLILAYIRLFICIVYYQIFWIYSQSCQCIYFISTKREKDKLKFIFGEIIANFV